MELCSYAYIWPVLGTCCYCCFLCCSFILLLTHFYKFCLDSDLQICCPCKSQDLSKGACEYGICFVNKFQFSVNYFIIRRSSYCLFKDM